MTLLKGRSAGRLDISRPTGEYRVEQTLIKGDGGVKLERYDIVFIGQMGMGKVVPFHGSPFVESGSPVLFAAVAAASLGKKIAAATTVSPTDEYLLEPLRDAGVDLFVQPGETAQYRVVFPTANVDERLSYLIRSGSPINTIPPFEPCLAHLCCIGAREAQLDLMRSLRARGFRLSVDMQGLILQADAATQEMDHRDVPEKTEILRLTNVVKMDALEARILTGSENGEDQVKILEGWGVGEIIITSAEGALARYKGQTTFATFTNRSIRGRMGRGDTVIGSYLARRLDHSVEDSLRFAAALASIKMESSGPFRGCIDDVIQRMNQSMG